MHLLYQHVLVSMRTSVLTLSIMDPAVPEQAALVPQSPDRRPATESCRLSGFQQAQCKVGAFKAYISTIFHAVTAIFACPPRITFFVRLFRVFVTGRWGWRVHLVDEVKDLLLHQAAGVAAKHLGLEVEDDREDGQQSAHEDLPARKCLQSGGGG